METVFLIRPKKTKAAYSLQAEDSVPLQVSRRKLILRDLIRKSEDIDADVVVGPDYRRGATIRNDETGVNLKRIAVAGMAVKLSCERKPSSDVSDPCAA